MGPFSANLAQLVPDRNNSYHNEYERYGKLLLVVTFLEEGVGNPHLMGHQVRMMGEVPKFDFERKS